MQFPNCFLEEEGKNLKKSDSGSNEFLACKLLESLSNSGEKLMTVRKVNILVK